MGMVKKSITVTDQQNDWIQSQLSNGHYASDSEVIREALREKALRMSEIDMIRAKLVASEASGLSDLTPAQIRNAAKLQLKQDDQI
ncbi:ribbon-helix-helix domain-containing protein [Planktotalea arctica]|uniref:ribbon-helix-helix domain-containing protein n=1 Tax=Planktotalea arctica TaxID=1481893 RepID=UPI00321A101B